jgi:hypothetical protein
MHTGIEAYSTVTSGIKEIIQSTDPHPKAATHHHDIIYIRLTFIY